MCPLVMQKSKNGMFLWDLYELRSPTSTTSFWVVVLQQSISIAIEQRGDIGIVVFTRGYEKIISTKPPAAQLMMLNSRLLLGLHLS